VNVGVTHLLTCHLSGGRAKPYNHVSPAVFDGQKLELDARGTSSPSRARNEQTPRLRVISRVNVTATTPWFVPRSVQRHRAYHHVSRERDFVTHTFRLRGFPREFDPITHLGRDVRSFLQPEEGEVCISQSHARARSLSFSHARVIPVGGLRVCRSPL